MRTTDELSAVVEYVVHSQHFVPADGATLDGFLSHAAKRNLQNRLRTERRRDAREREYARQGPRFTELAPSDEGDEREHHRALQRVLAVVCSRDELSPAKMWLRDVAATDAIAAKLQLGHLPIAMQRREVKRFKDRVVKRISRYIERHPPEVEHRAPVGNTEVQVGRR